LWDVPADAGFLCGKAAMLKDTMKGTACKWEINISNVTEEREIVTAI